MESKWKRVYLVIMAFYVFDYVSTFLYCSSPDEEGGFLPHYFMTLTDSVLVGLTLNILFSAVLWAIVIFKVSPPLFKRIEESPHEKYVEALEISLFVLLGYFPALDFAGATSWYWHIPVIHRVIIGLVIYLISLIWIKPFEK